MPKTATLFLLLTCVLEGLFPIVSNLIAPDVPYFFFLAITTSITAVFFGVYLVCTGGMMLPSKAVLFMIAGNALITALYYLSIFVGTRFTSGINTALLTRTEILTTFVFSCFVLRERLSTWQYIGAMLLLIGVIALLYNGSLQLNKGDLLLISMTLLLPFANHWAKQALQIIRPAQVLFYRFFFSAMFLLPCALISRDWMSMNGSVHSVLLWACIYGVLYFGLLKLIWYRALVVSDLGRSIYIISGYPAFSMLFAFFLLSEVPSLFQGAGFVLVMTGIVLLSQENSTVQTEADLV